MLLLILALILWIFWYVPIARINRLTSSHKDRIMLYLAPIFCLILLGFLLADRSAVKLLLPFGLLINCYGAGALLLAVAFLTFPLWGWGISPLEDLAVRRNRFVGWVVLGALLGLTLEFGLATRFTFTVKGDIKPVQVIGLMIFSFLGIFCSWGILEKFGDLSEIITIDRDGGAALRLTVFLPMEGTLLGRAFASLHHGSLDTWGNEYLTMLGAPFALLFIACWIEGIINLARRHPKPEIPLENILTGMGILAAITLWFLFGSCIVGAILVLIAAFVVVPLGSIFACIWFVNWLKSTRRSAGQKPQFADVLVCLIYIAFTGLGIYLYDILAALELLSKTRS